MNKIMLDKNNMINKVENFVFVNCRKGDKITKTKPKHELKKNLGYLNTFSQKSISEKLFFYL